MFHYLLSIVLIITWSRGEPFSVSPGDGRNFVYSPVDRNATIFCAVSGEVLEWAVDGLNFESRTEALDLYTRRIFKSTTEVLPSGVTTSSVILFGDISDNNRTQVCCQTIESGEATKNCTTLVIYDRPSPPEQVSINHIGDLNVNISWIASTQTGVTQNYSVIIYSMINPIEVSENYYIHEMIKLTTSCGLFLAYVKAVNGAGESDPSNNVTIPSLPDIEPVTASLTHQVWKSNGHIMVNVSFQPARYCKEYPLLSHMLTVRSQQTRQPFLHNMSLATNETEVVLDNLEGEQKYVYAITATNEIGVTNTSGEKELITSDVQNVTAIMKGSMIELQCQFIPGSDATGCQVSLRSDCPGVSDIKRNISRNGTMATRRFNVAHNISCYRQVVAYTIDINNTISTLSIEGIVQPTVDNTQRDGTPNQVIAIIVPTVLFVAVILMVTIFLTIWKKTKRRTVCPECSKNIPLEKESSAKESPTSQDKKTAEQDTSPTYATVNPAEASTIKQNDAYNIGVSTSVIQAESMPIYALPDKLKCKNTTDQTEKESDKKDKAEDPYNQLDEHLYHVLEGGQTTKVDTADPQTYESPKKCLKHSSDVSDSAPSPGPVYQDVLKLSAKKEKTESSAHQEQPPNKSATSGETAAATKDEVENKVSDVSDQPSTSAKSNT